MKGCVVDGYGRCDAGESHRIYLCGRCGKVVTICRRCDRGNVYCASGCAEVARRELQRGYNAENQKTPQGAMKHADREARYRRRLREKVTEQGSAAAPPLPKEEGKQTLVADPETTAVVAVESEDQAAAEVEPTAFEPFLESTSADGSFESSEPIDTFLGPEVRRQARCDFCGRRCGVYSRNGFLERS